METHYAKIYFMKFVNHAVKTQYFNLTVKSSKLEQNILVHNIICLRLAEYLATNMEISFLFMIITAVVCISFNLFRVSFLSFNLFKTYILMTNILLFIVKQSKNV